MSSRLGRTAACVAGAGMALAAGLAVGHEMGPVPNTPAAKAVVARHQTYKQLGAAFKAVADQSKKRAPDKAVVTANAQKIAALSRQMPTWFPKGSGAESGAKTGAKPQVWSDPQGFAAAVQRMQAEAGKLQQVAASGDAKALKAQVQATGGACKGCHDKYRLPDEH